MHERISYAEMKHEEHAYRMHDSIFLLNVLKLAPLVLAFRRQCHVRVLDASWDKIFAKRTWPRVTSELTMYRRGCQIWTMPFVHGDQDGRFPHSSLSEFWLMYEFVFSPLILILLNSIIALWDVCTRITMFCLTYFLRLRVC